MKLNANDFDHYQNQFTRNFDHFETLVKPEVDLKWVTSMLETDIGDDM